MPEIVINKHLILSLEIIIDFFHVLICFLSLICQGFLSTMYTKLIHRRTIFFVDKLIPKQTSFCLGRVDSILLHPVRLLQKESFICMLDIFITVTIDLFVFLHS